MRFRRPSGEETAMSEDAATSLSAQIVTIPPAVPGRARTLVLCFDGTGNQVGDQNTNVVEIHDMLKVSEGEQLVYYQKGIGTYTPKVPGVNEPVRIPGLSFIIQEWDEAFAWSLDGHVREAYLWLVDNYRDGDKVCMFGFSRGAYTARAVAGMLFKVGLLPKAHREMASAALSSYKDAKTAEAWEASMAFQKRWGSVDVIIEFLGCWDTVNSVGYFTNKTLPFTAYNPMVRTFRHAISIDERRAKFRTNLWSPSGIPSREIAPKAMSPLQQIIHNFSEEKSKGLPHTNVDGVWFSGCHCDVGGGSVANKVKPNLAHIPLRWMIRQCFMQDTGTMFRKDKLEAFHLDPNSLYPVLIKPRPSPVPPKSNKIQSPIPQGPIATVEKWIIYLNPFRTNNPVTTPIANNEEEADALDALAPIYDMLEVGSFFWLFVEKMKLETYDPKLNQQVKKVFNKKPRTIRGPRFVDAATGAVMEARPRLHRTVRTRMGAKYEDGSCYVPKALLPPDMKNISPSETGFSGGHPPFDWAD